MMPQPTPWDALTTAGISGVFTAAIVLCLVVLMQVLDLHGRLVYAEDATRYRRARAFASVAPMHVRLNTNWRVVFRLVVIAYCGAVAVGLLIFHVVVGFAEVFL